MRQVPVENSDVVQRGKAILSVLGSFWTEIHQDKRLWQFYGRGLGELLAQRFVDFLYTITTLSRKTVPVHQTITWRRLTFTESELANSRASMLRYGEGAVYGITEDGLALYLYGGLGTSQFQKLDVSSEVAHISVLTSTPVSPSVALVHGTDFWVDRELRGLVFRENPFDNSDMPIVNILDDQGQVSDRSITLWGFDNLDDMEDISNRYGVLVGLSGESSETLRTVVNAIIDSFVDGPSFHHLLTFVCAIVGLRPVRSDGEIVEDIQETGTQQVVATNANVYRISKNAVVTVEVGDTVNRGETLCDTVTTYRTPAELSQFYGLTISKAFGDVLRHPIAFPNQAAPVILTTEGGRTKIALDLYGDPVTRRQFWENVHARGVAAGTTLANHYDIREAPVGEPTLVDLPKFLNPFLLLTREFQGAFAIIRLRSAGFTDRAMQSVMSPIIQSLTPPRLTCLILVEHVLDLDYYGLTDTASETQPGTEEEEEAHDCVTFTDDAILPADDAAPGDPYIDDTGPTAWVISNPCPVE